MFKIGKDGKDNAALHNFAEFRVSRDDGRNPCGPPTQSKGGVLFGTTLVGGGWNGGIVFRLNTNGTDYRILHHFGYGNTAYGIAGDGMNPRGALVHTSDGDVYGTTEVGGLPGGGTVFAISEEGRNYRRIHTFLNTPHDGAKPFAGLIEGSDGKLYGTTVAGGRASQGVVFRLNKDGTAYQILRHTTGTGAEGRNPYGGLVEGKDGALYGTTLGGGPHVCGVVFRMNRDGGDYRLIYAFPQPGREGRSPYAGLTQGSDGALYGTTCNRGNEGIGTVFCLKVPSAP